MSDNLMPELARPDFLNCPSELPSLIAGFDWSRTSLGPIDEWPQSLRTITGFLVRSPTPIVLLWGPGGVMIYNDGYSVFAGGRHPELLGMKVRDAWPEVADFNDNVLRVGLAGGTLSYKDQELTLYRTARMPEQVWMNLDYSPVLGDDGKPAGVIAIVVETTERILAERRIASELERQRQTFDQMPGFVGVLSGPDHVYQYVNDAYRQISGRSDFIGRTVRQVFPDLAGQGFFELLDQVYASGQRVVTRGMELRLHGSGEVQFIDFVYEPIRDKTGAVSGIFVGGYEVTEVYRATEALRSSEEQLRLATENAEIRLWDVDVVTDTLYWPPRVKAMFGISAGVSVSMKDFYDGLHPDDCSRTSEAYARAADPAIRALYDVEYRTIGKEDRVTRWVAAKGRGVFDAQNKCIRVIGTALDITERKLVEQQLRDLNENLEHKIIDRTQARGLTWQVSPDLMGALNSEGCFETSNPAWRAVLGWSEEEVASMSIFELLHPDDLERTRAGFELTQQGQPAIRFPNRYRCRDGSYRWISWVGVPEDGMVYCTGRDIMDEKAAEAELASAQEVPLVLMDEPLSNLDAKLRLEMRQEIRRIHATLGSITIYVTHDQDEALSLADRIVVLKDGDIRQIGTPSDLYARPAHRDVAEFMGFRNQITGPVRETSGDMAAIDVAGTVLRGRNVGATSGRNAVASIRPDDLAPVAEGGIPAIVEAIEYRGKDFFGQARDPSGSPLFFRSDIPLSAGAAVRLGADPSRVIIFGEEAA